jgi:hypothetical protein
MVETVQAIEYITPLREGGSLPAIVGADDGEFYVMKFVGAGQGPKALIAEWVVGEIGRALGLHVPKLVFMELDGAFGKSEPDQEIQDLLRASAGLNLGMQYLPHATMFNPLMKPPPDPALASNIVWFDAYVTNVDRTARNVNLLLWGEALWLIDHGAALYFHHDWGADYLGRSRTPFTRIKDHVLLRWATELPAADARLRSRLDEGLIRDIVAAIPDAWLGNEPVFANPTENRQAYVRYLLSRLEAAPVFVEEAIRAQAKLV